MVFIPGQELICACRIWTGSREAEVWKELRAHVKTRTLQTQKGFGTPAGFNRARTKHRCRAEGFATRQGFTPVPRGRARTCHNQISSSIFV